MSKITVNGRTYQLPRERKAVICVDGCEPDYLAQAVAAGVMPWLKGVLKTGTHTVAHCVVPTFTNPNNLSIVTGVPPAIHGICGNYLYDRDTQTEVMMNDPKWLKAPTILKSLADAGVRVGVVTAKDKLRRLLGHQMKGICFSSEKSADVTLEENGISDVLSMVNMPVPDVYSANLSEFIFAAGVELFKRDLIDVAYLSTTDYIQHKHAPGTAEANSFYAMLDGYMAKLDQLNVAIALTADHGMNSKTSMDGSPNVIYLTDVLKKLTDGNAVRVILPITDPYVVHHGALGSFATVYIDKPAAVVKEIAEKLSALQGIESVLTREEAAARFELPADRLGDLVIVSERFTVLGSEASRHDLSGLDAPLRSHGGVSEQLVPLILNRQYNTLPNHRYRNFDAFDWVLNYVV